MAIEVEFLLMNIHDRINLTVISAPNLWKGGLLLVAIIIIWAFYMHF